MQNKPTKDERIAPILAELIDKHPEWLNSQYADEIARLTGENMTKKDVSRIRSKIGLDFYSVIHRENFDRLVKQAEDQIAAQDASSSTPPVAILMGSKSDLEVMKEAVEILESFNVPHHLEVISAHRTPERLQEFAQNARDNGFKVIIAGAGGAAHLPGMIAASTTLPVIGVPIPTKHLTGQDSLYSIVQMPKGVPVATVAIGGAANAALLAIQMLSIEDKHLAERLEAYKDKQRVHVAEMNQGLNNPRSG